MPAKMKKTIIVSVTQMKEHPKYKKRYRVSKKHYAYAEDGKYKPGDTVTIYECRPLSRLKRWTTIKPDDSKYPKI